MRNPTSSQIAATLSTRYAISTRPPLQVLLAHWNPKACFSAVYSRRVRREARRKWMSSVSGALEGAEHAQWEHEHDVHRFVAWREHAERRQQFDQPRYAPSDDPIPPSKSRTVTPHVAKGTSNNLTLLLHTTLDLILVVSVPPSSAVIKNDARLCASAARRAPPALTRHIRGRPGSGGLNACAGGGCLGTRSSKSSILESLTDRTAPLLCFHIHTPYLLALLRCSLAVLYFSPSTADVGLAPLPSPGCGTGDDET